MDKISESVDLERNEYDVIVIGTGMGGATIGYALAKSGKKVLFCEKGRSHLTGDESFKGDYAENFSERQPIAKLKDKEVLARAGRWWDEIEDVSSERSQRFVPFIGCGTGGSSALYGMALERFYPVDFTPGHYFTEHHASTIPDAWPINYADLEKYYELAEQLYRVRGTADLLQPNAKRGHFRSPPALSPDGEEIHTFLLGRGLHPYRLPVGCEFKDGCPCCQSFLCEKNCKNDSATICLEPAIKNFGARLIEHCEVLRLEATRNKVGGVVCRVGERLVVLRGKIVILAAGALSTPQILLNSASTDWPKGLANSSGLVGKNLMRHFIDLYAIKTKSQEAKPSGQKELAFNDFYTLGEQKFGTVQSFGSLPPIGILLKGLNDDLRKSPFRCALPLFNCLKPVLRVFLSRMFADRTVLASIMEDLPYMENRVELSSVPDPSGRSSIRISYSIRPSEKMRINALRKAMSRLLKPYSFLRIKQSENNERIAHACGTCRFGLDPQKSVLNSSNRAHGLENLYIVDASFFPTSGGTNPALTIAANALRVAEHINGQSISGTL